MLNDGVNIILLLWLAFRKKDRIWLPWKPIFILYAAIMVAMTTELPTNGESDMHIHITNFHGSNFNDNDFRRKIVCDGGK